MFVVSCLGVKVSLVIALVTFSCEKMPEKSYWRKEGRVGRVEGRKEGGKGGYFVSQVEGTVHYGDESMVEGM